MKATKDIHSNGTYYKSDRFYLLQQSTGRHESNAPENPTERGGCRCTCGADNPPPLVNREALINSLELKAAVLGTFSFDLAWLKRTWPKLVGPTSSIPTLILHGKRGFEMNKVEPPKRNIRADEHEGGDGSSFGSHEDNWGGSDVGSQSPEVKTRIPHVNFNLDLQGDDDNGDGNDRDIITSVLSRDDSIATQASQVEIQNLHDHNNYGKVGLLESKDPTSFTAPNGKFLHITEVQSACHREEDSGITREPQRIKPKDISSKRGVYHPKFMLLYEKSGDIVVVVTTANLSQVSTSEGWWMQRFKRRQAIHPCNTRTLKGSSKNNTRANDFGPVLTDFLCKMSSFARPGHFTVDSFFKKYFGYPLEELSSRFCFDDAEAQLVPIIPGDFEIRNTANANMYGRERLESLLSNDTNGSSDSDHLLMQSTSFGARWTREQMANMVRSYLGLKNAPNGQHILNQLKIVWPSARYINLSEGSRRHSNVRLETKTIPVSATTQNDGTPFFSTIAFNSCEESCIVRMAHFEEASPAQISLCAPHLKSVVRLCQEQGEAKRIEKIYGPANEYIPWALLTSACLSYGAQGNFGKTKAGKSCTSYANFELGVLFQSQLVGPRTASRLYCFKPNQCSCGVRKGGSGLIHLPIPFNLRPKMYVDDPEYPHFNEIPFFHETTDDSRCVGNMMLTPNAMARANSRPATQIKKRKHMQADSARFPKISKC